MRLSSAYRFRSAVCSILACALIATELHGQAAAPAPADNKGAATQPSVLKFKRYTVQDDRQFRGMVAGAGVMPLGWTVKSAVGPKLNLRIHWGDDQDTSACDVYPPLTFKLLVAKGVRTPADLRPPPSDQFEAITKVFIPQFRPDLAKAKVVDKQKMPQLGQAIYNRDGKNFKGKFQLSAGYVMFEYDLHGKTVREAVSLVMEESQGPGDPYLWWTLMVIRSRRSPKELFDANLPIEQTTLQSFQDNPAWDKQVNDFRMGRLNQQNAQRNANFQATENRVAADSQAEDVQQQTYENHMADLETQSNNEADVQRDVSPWQSSDGTVYKLSNQYGAAWQGSDGTVLMGNDPSYNPNADASLPSNATWTQMQQTKN